jgi:hypothetical protein
MEAHRVVRRWGSHILSRQSAHRWRWGCQPNVPAAFYPPGRFLVLISVKKLSRPQGHSAAGRIRSIEKIHLIGTRIRDLPACSIVPQPTTLPSEIKNWYDKFNICLIFPNSFVGVYEALAYYHNFGNKTNYERLWYYIADWSCNNMFYLLLLNIWTREGSNYVQRLLLNY